MTRVSLKEAYDNKDVVAQIYSIRDIAEGAEDTANNASASAQASAQTVAGYENRLSNVELKVTTVEGDIVTIQGRITALETADGQNVKLSGDQNITGIKTVPTEATGTHSQQIANSAKIVAELDNYSPMVRTTGNQPIAGTKTFTSRVIIRANNIDATQPGTETKHSSVDFRFNDINGVDLAHIYLQQYVDGRIAVYLVLRNTDGTMKYVSLGISDVVQ